MQPGPGYTFSASSSGTTLNIQQPWGEWDSGGDGLCPLQIYNLHYSDILEEYYINVSPGMVNNYGVTDYDGHALTHVPAPDIQVFADGISEEFTTNYIYIACDNSGPPNYDYPDPAVAPYILVRSVEEVSDDETGLLLIGIVKGKTNPETDVDTLQIFNYKGCGSLWSERFKCGSGAAQYWWSAV